MYVCAMRMYWFLGAQVGNIVTIQLGGFLIRHTKLWTSVFYIFGVLGIFWLMFWFVLVYNHPNRNPFISSKEKTYLNGAIKSIDLDNVSITTIINSIADILNEYIQYWMFFVIILGFANNSLETNCNIGTRVGVNNCSDWSRLEFIHRSYQFA